MQANSVSLSFVAYKAIVASYAFPANPVGFCGVAAGVETGSARRAERNRAIRNRFIVVSKPPGYLVLLLIIRVRLIRILLIRISVSEKECIERAAEGYESHADVLAGNTGVSQNRRCIRRAYDRMKLIDQSVQNWPEIDFHKFEPPAITGACFDFKDSFESVADLH